MLFELLCHLFASHCFVTFRCFCLLGGGSMMLFVVFLCFVFCGCLWLPVSFINVVALHISFMLAMALTLMSCFGVVVVRLLNLCVNLFFSFSLLCFAFVSVLLFTVRLVWNVVCQKHEIAWTRQHQTSPWHCDARCTMCSSLAHDGHVRQGVHSLMKRHQNGPGCLSI